MCVHEVPTQWMYGHILLGPPEKEVVFTRECANFGFHRHPCGKECMPRERTPTYIYYIVNHSGILGSQKHGGIGLHEANSC